MYKEYGLKKGHAVLQIDCEKGFLLYGFHRLYPGLEIWGTDISDYAIGHAMEEIKLFIQKAPFTELPFEDSKFDLIIAIGVVYTLNLEGVIKCLKEIQRTGKRKSFITLAAYRTEEERKLIEWWTLLGTTILLHEDEWVEVLKHTGYTGDYKFTTAHSLNLIRSQD